MDTVNAKRILRDILTTQSVSQDSTLRASYLELISLSYGPKLSKMLSESEFFFRRDDEKIISSGSNQMVLSLDNGSVAKLRYFDISFKNVSSEKHKGMQKEFDKYVILGPYESGLDKNYAHLTEMGFKVPFHEFFSIKFDQSFNQTIYACITEDLTSDGKYLLLEADEENISLLPNAPQIRSEMDEKVSLLKKYTGKGKDYYIEINRHSSEDNPLLALEHLFLLKVDQGYRSGELVLGDIDNIFVHKK